MIELLTSHLISTDSNPLRCLFGIEAILKEDLLSSDVALSLLSPHLTSIQSSQDKAIRAKALKILRQLERLEADTNLDQPLMSEGHLDSLSVLADVEAGILGSTVNSTPLKTSPPAEESPVLNMESKASQGSLFSGMTVATRTAMSSGEHRAVGSSAKSATRRESGEQHAVTDLLMDSELMLNSDSEANLLQSNSQPSLATRETEEESTRGIVKACAHNSTNVSLPGSNQKSSDSETAYESTKDPIMSREAGFADLWNTVSPNKESLKASHQHLPQVNPATVNVPQQQHPNMASQQPVMTAQHISQLYPQLSSANLSGTSSTPINLAKKPVTGFGFVVDSNDENEKAGVSRDAFSFIQDAMKSSKS